jgi:hypothetical protein
MLGANIVCWLMPYVSRRTGTQDPNRDYAGSTDNGTRPELRCAEADRRSANLGENLSK